MRCPPLCSALFIVLLAAAGCESGTGPAAEEPSSYRHVRAFWSPTGDRVGYTNSDEGSAGIWSVDTSGSNVQQIHSGIVGGGTWSPDGQWVAFFEVGRIVARKVGGDSVWVLVSAANSIRPSWSSDGRTIAFIRSGVMALDLASGVETWISTSGSFVHWFPGTRSVLVAAVDIEGGQYAYSLYRNGVDSTSIQGLFTLRTSDNCAFFVPSSDGSKIFFGRMPLRARSQVWSVSVPGLHMQQLTSDGGDYPAVSPDGQWIVYTRTAPGDGGLWLMRSDGTEKRRLTTP